MRKRQAFRPAVDPLEDRLALSAVMTTDPDNIQSGDQVQVGDQSTSTPDVPGTTSPESDVGSASIPNIITAQKKSKGAVTHPVTVVHHPTRLVVHHGKRF